MDSIDSDGDGMIDVTEFIGSLENLEDHEEALEAHRPEREFHTNEAHDVKNLERQCLANHSCWLRYPHRPRTGQCVDRTC